jgi:hypothetical protein
MRDWQKLVEERLSGLALEPEEKAEIIAELAAHLEDVYDAMRRQGIAEEEAAQQALSRVGNWRHLENRVFAVKRREHFMRNRVRQLWVPGFLTMILSTLFLMMLPKLGFQPRLIGSGPNAILFYGPWLLSLLLFGALGAYVSSRAGGSRGTVVLASVFPALALTGAFLSMFPIGFAIERIVGIQEDFGVVATALLKDGIDWIVVPGAVLLAGGLPVQSWMGRGAREQRATN